MIRKQPSKNPKPRSPVSADVDMGERIRARRIEQKMSQQELAAFLGVSFQQIQKYEKGLNRVNANRLVVIASALKMPTEDFHQSDEILPDVSSLIDVNSKDAMRMIRAWTRIKDQATRRQAVALVETIADAAEKITIEG